MKKDAINKIGIMSALLVMLFLPASLEAEDLEYTAKIAKLSGIAEVRPRGAADWATAKEGTALKQGYIFVTTPKTSALIEIKTGSAVINVRIEGGAQLLFLRPESDKGEMKRAIFDVGAGEVLVDVSFEGGENPGVKIKTPTSLIDIEEGSFSVKVGSSK